MRTITFASTVGSIEPVQTSAVYFKDIFDILDSKGINRNNMRLFIAGSNLELSHADAKLPEGDFKLMMFAKQSKAGSTSALDAISVLENRVENIKDIISNLNEEIESLDYRLYELKRIVRENTENTSYDSRREDSSVQEARSYERDFLNGLD
jgi:hypothetical protein|uniref:DNA-binding regulatory protein n=1 Tax=Podoviridae sp. ctQyH19 TaxID=2825249 RepID=A0A8S5UQV6_9CAUD|nr:MAG TPA: DNA-binding regulatory protein [Podoviridae sp. ctQyH19]